MAGSNDFIARGHDVARSLAALAAVEARSGALAGKGASGGRYLRIGKWCLARSFLKRLHLGPGRAKAWRELRAISDFTPATLALHLLRARPVEAAAQADAVVLRNNVRAVYSGARLTLKLPNPLSAAGPECIGREVRVRRALKTTPAVTVPALVEASDAEGASYLVEDLVLDARRCDPGRHDLGSWAEPLLGFYVANGASLVPSTRAFDAPAELARLGEGLSALAIAPVAGLAETVLETTAALAAEQHRLLCAITNGDLAPSNILFKEGHMIVLDWEYGRDDLVFSDLVRLASASPAFGAALERAAAGLSASLAGRLAPVKAQLLLGAVVAINRRIERFRNFQTFEPEASAAPRYVRKISAILDFAHRLMAATPVGPQARPGQRKIANRAPNS